MGGFAPHPNGSDDDGGRRGSLLPVKVVTRTATAMTRTLVISSTDSVHRLSSDQVEKDKTHGQITDLPLPVGTPWFKAPS